MASMLLAEAYLAGKEIPDKNKGRPALIMLTTLEAAGRPMVFVSFVILIVVSINPILKFALVYQSLNRLVNPFSLVFISIFKLHPPRKAVTLDGKKGYTWRRQKVADKFLRHCEERRYLKFGAIEGSLRVFMALPPEIQVCVMSANGCNDIYQCLVKGLLDVELRKELEKLGPRKEEFVRIAKEIHKKFPRKK
jgi:hypothetical protein